MDDPRLAEERAFGLEALRVVLDEAAYLVRDLKAAEDPEERERILRDLRQDLIEAEGLLAWVRRRM
jgi:hypothetical protein